VQTEGLLALNKLSWGQTAPWTQAWEFVIICGVSGAIRLR